MPQHSPAEPSLAKVFQALSDPTRLAVVERLSIGPAAATELARPFEMALASFMHHLGLLERDRPAPAPLDRAPARPATFRNHWERRLDQLDDLLLAQHRSEQERS